MNKNALRCLIAGALLSPATLFALGLGDIRLNSALNQPFDADIDLASATADELSSLKVSLASEEAFRRYGLDRPNFLTGFSFRLDGATSAQPVIKVRSASAVSEPFLNLLVEVSWTGGRVLREYTVLLDPPVMGPAAQISTPVQAPVSAAANAGAIVRSAAPVTAPVAAPAQSSVRRPAAAAPDSYTVRNADTLSKIAGAMAQGNDFSSRQAMLAIYRANPGAFDGNMNVLRSGSVLRIPPAADIAAISAGEANAEVSRQTGLWRTAVATSAPAEAGAERLRLVPAEQRGSTAGGAAGNTAANAASDARVRALEAELAEARRLLDLKNAELARMQSALGGAQSAANMAAAASSSAEAAQSSAASSVEATEPVAEEAASSASAQPEPTPAPAAMAAAPAAPAAAEPGLFSKLSQYATWLIGGALVLILGLLVWARRRQQQAEEESTDTFTAQDFAAHISRKTADQSASSVSVVESTGEFRPLADADDEGDFELPKAATRTAGDDTLSSETAIHVDQQDALAEADFHMAYGLYDQAADIVKLAIERDPQRRDLKVKLAEIFFVWGNPDSFLEVAQQLHDTQDEAPAGEWDKVLIMGKQICPDAALFAGDIAGSRSGDHIDVNLEGGEHHVDIDLFEAPSAEQPGSDIDFELASTAERPRNDDAGLDFLLDEPQRGVDDEPTREIESNARTQETPAIESSSLPDRGAVTIREKLDHSLFDEEIPGADRTAELSIDEIGLSMGDADDDAADFEVPGQIGDDELTRIAERESAFDSETKTLLAPHIEQGDSLSGSTGDTVTVEEIDLDDTHNPLDADLDGTGTFRSTQKIDVNFDQLNGIADTAEQLRPDAGSTGIFNAPAGLGLDMDLDHLADPRGFAPVGDTVKQVGRAADEVDAFSAQVFGGEAAADSNDTNLTEVMDAELDMGTIEPATMSEVGTKLDLARAYMDMGDPDGARSILQEVLDEGNPGQKQEAQRLLSSIG